MIDGFEGSVSADVGFSNEQAMRFVSGPEDVLSPEEFEKQLESPWVSELITVYGLYSLPESERDQCLRAWWELNRGNSAAMYNSVRHLRMMGIISDEEYAACKPKDR